MYVADKTKNIYKVKLTVQGTCEITTIAKSRLEAERYVQKCFNENNSICNCKDLSILTCSSTKESNDEPS